jgi:rhamnulose-1-phosphate aldolase
MVVWSQHGEMSRADNSIFHALDLMEYAETAAHYEYLKLTAGGWSEGLSPGLLRASAKSWKIRQNIF